MRRWNAVCLLLLLLSNCIVASLEADDDLQPGNLVARSKWAQFDVVLGRLKLVNTRLGQNLNAKSELPGQGTSEELNFSARTAESASLRYRYLDQNQQLIVEVERTDQVVIEQSPVNGAKEPIGVVLRQPRNGPLTLIVDDPQQPVEIMAISLWHLILQEPALCEEHLLPVLSSLRTDWRLNVEGKKIEQVLLRQAKTGQVSNRNRMRLLVDQLGADSFRQRQSADQQLRQLGMTVIAFFDQLDATQLDAEQRMRIGKIRRRLTHRNGDTPERVAAWLSFDPAAWLALLDRDDLETRVVAVERLAQMQGRSVDFDVQADAVRRRRQWNQLRQNLGLDDRILMSSRSASSLQR